MILIVTVIYWLYYRKKPIIFVDSLYIYPIKSCAGIRVNKICLTKIGFKYDRKYCIINKKKKCLSQNQIPKLCLIKPYLIENNTILKLTAPNMTDPLLIKINDDKYYAKQESYSIDYYLCSQPIFVHDINEKEKVSKWLEICLGQKDLRLVYISNKNIRDPEPRYLPNTESTPNINNFSNFAHACIGSIESLNELNKRLISNNKQEVNMEKK